MCCLYFAKIQNIGLKTEINYGIRIGTKKYIVKTFPGVLALSDMNFDLMKGEIHAICGENGAGKSTLMNIVTGVYKADSGDILIDGQKKIFEDPNDAFFMGIAIIHQETSLFEEMSILENIFFRA